MPACATFRAMSANSPGTSCASTTTTSRSPVTARLLIASACFTGSECGTRMCSSAISAGPVQVAALMFTPASLTAAATRSRAPGSLGISIFRS